MPSQGLQAIHRRAALGLFGCWRQAQRDWQAFLRQVDKLQDHAPLELKLLRANETQALGLQIGNLQHQALLLQPPLQGLGLRQLDASFHDGFAGVHRVIAGDLQHPRLGIGRSRARDARGRKVTHDQAEQQQAEPDQSGVSRPAGLLPTRRRPCSVTHRRQGHVVAGSGHRGQLGYALLQGGRYRRQPLLREGAQVGQTRRRQGFNLCRQFGVSRDGGFDFHAALRRQLGVDITSQRFDVRRHFSSPSTNPLRSAVRSSNGPVTGGSSPCRWARRAHRWPRGSSSPQQRRAA